MSNWAGELKFAKSLAHEAGKIINQYFLSELLEHEWKDDDTPITIADRKVNSFVIDEVKKHYPDHGIFGEEESYKPERELVWVVDPIDGTIPFTLGVPVSTFAMALVDRADGQPVISVVYDPFLDELFYAERGKGAFCNDIRITTGDYRSIKKSYFVIGGAEVVSSSGWRLPKGRFVGIINEKGGRSMNYISGTYMAMRIASGRIAGLFMGYSFPWDIAAPALIVQEAGGVVRDVDGNKRRFDERGNGCIMTCNQSIMDNLLKILEDNYESR